jgi:aspartate-semialdehyde dehydrogenase
MKSEPVVAIVGATGVVGNEMMNVINQRSFPACEVRLLASENSRGEVYTVLGEECVVEALDDSAFEDVDIALFATSGELSEQYVPVAVEAGAYAIDNSSFFRMKEGVPLIVPEVNISTLKREDKIIANPNCSTIQLVPVLKVLQDAAGLERVVVSTYQSVSGAGKAALDELWNQTRAVYAQQEIKCEAFAHQIAFNCIPQIDVIMNDGFTKEEYKIINESRKILGLPDLRITATAVRVPVFHSHAESVNVELKKELSPQQLVELLSKVEGIHVYPSASEFPLQIEVAGEDNIFVGRIRQDSSVPHGLSLWIVADNLRKGAALNAVQIAEHLVKKFA